MDFPIKNGDVPLLCNSSPEGSRDDLTVMDFMSERAMDLIFLLEGHEIRHPTFSVLIAASPKAGRRD